MEESATRRYVFIDFDNLRKTKFKKLEKVCDKLFVFVDANEKNVPLRLVLQMQNFGKNAKWIAIDELSENQGMNFHIAFVMGKLHEKVSKEVEFAVLSNDEALDPLIKFINISGDRNCLRVQRKKETEDYNTSFSLADEMAVPISVPATQTEAVPEMAVMSSNFEMEEQYESDHSFSFVHDSSLEPNFIERTAEETVQLLIRSGNRPALISTLKNYILLHHQELTGHGNIDKVIHHLEDKSEIEVHEGEFLYHF